MKTPRLAVLGTRVARRVLFLFTLGAAAPVVVMSVLSFAAITSQLESQREERLSELTAAATQSILERLIGLRSFLGSVSTLAGGGETIEAALATVRLPAGVLGLRLDRADREPVVAGTPGQPPALDEADRARLASGGALLRIEDAADGRPALAFLGVPVPGTAPPATLWGRIVGDSIWAMAVTRAEDPAVDEMCLVTSSGSPLHCTGGPGSPLLGLVEPPSRRSENSGVVEISLEDGVRTVGWRDVYLAPGFGAPSWTVMVSQEPAALAGPVNAFVYNLLLVVLVGIACALLLTHVLVRRTMEPLRELTDGTLRVARQDLTARVDVRSNDEFGDLAASFNTMAERLLLHFRHLEAGREIDRAALVEADPNAAIKALLDGVGQVVGGGHRALVVREYTADALSAYAVHGAGEIEHRLILPADAGPDPLGVGWPYLASSEDEVPQVLRPWRSAGGTFPSLVLPIQVDGASLGVMITSAPGGYAFPDDHRERAEHLVDQAAVALAKLKLDRDLRSISWEVLRALANAIDAKSPWTTGHSERVTRLSLVLGRELGLSSTDMNTVHRGGLLHDVGKIAVPVDVLDFDGPLTGEMRRMIQEHPAAGVRILEPIRAFQPILPIVLHHHERWDGNGYPAGLAGEEIPYLARLVAVADVFDAMASPRPYRPPLTTNDVLAHIVDEAGAHHDPEMVEALQRVIRAGWSPPQAEAEALIDA